MKLFFTWFIALLALVNGALANDQPPQSLVIVACRVDDLTGTRTPPGSPGAVVMPVDQGVHKYRDLELHINENQEYECKRVRLDLEDAVAQNYLPRPLPHLPVAFGAPSRSAPVTGALFAARLDPHWGKPDQCGRAGVVVAQEWNERNEGWAAVGVGCPTPIATDANADGMPDLDERGRVKIIGWKLPECPSYLPGTTNRMRCVYDDSLI